MSKLKVHETNIRSIGKVISFRIIEITVDTLILWSFVQPHEAFGLALLIEGICLTLHFLFERIWNRINFGRHAYRGKECKVCQK